jgi:hypothetical protein
MKVWVASYHLEERGGMDVYADYGVLGVYRSPEAAQRACEAHVGRDLEWARDWYDDDTIATVRPGYECYVGGEEVQ